MTERWQRELKKLTPQEMPEGVRERMERGPGPNPLPPRRQRVAAVVVAFAVFAAAGGFAYQALRNRKAPTSIGGSQGPAVNIDLRAAKVAPTATLSYLDATREGHASTTCWEPTPLPPAVGCTFDHWSQFEAKDFVSIPPGTKLAISGDAQSVRAMVESWDSSNGYSGGGLPPSIGGFEKTMVFVSDLGDLKAPVPLNLKPGIYQLVISARWPQGEQVFSFAIHISSGVTIDLRSGTVAPTATLSFGGSTRQGYGGATWKSTCWLESPWDEMCLNMHTPEFTRDEIVKILADTTLVVGGDSESVKGAVLAGGNLIVATSGVSHTVPFSSLHVVRELGALESPIALDLKPGSYVLAITGHWSQGTREFYFAIQIESPPPSVSPGLGCPFASQQPVAASTFVAIAPQDVLRSWVGYHPGDHFKPAAGVPDSWWVERSGVLIAWLRLANPPASTDPAELAIIDGQKCLGGP